ncbi:glycosyltransferase [Daejeonella oryzae]|uniref:glycosyltransferase n=1 Tax=Daejeonella oryzae TaxID=1122943 RepID=UPI0003F87AF4|nr:glycosyltransferase [Daejeonella oryzae]
MKRKIAVISEHASPLSILGGKDTAGQNVYVAELSKFLASSGYEVDIYTRWENKELPHITMLKPGVRVINVKAGPVEEIDTENLLPFMPEFRESMLSFIHARKINYDVIHANYWLSALVACQLKEILGIPFVVTFHELGHISRMHLENPDPSLQTRISIELDVIKKADHVIAECPQDKLDLMNYYYVPAFKITTIPCGFNPDEFYPVNKIMARNVLNLHQDEYILLQLGRMEEHKGIDTIIRSLSRLKKLKRTFRLIIVGGETVDDDLHSNSEINRLHRIAEEIGVAQFVTFVGKKSREMLKYYYSAADVFITTPWFETFGITPLEAMACGTPVIGSNVGGIKYSVLDGITGLLTPTRNSDSLAEKIIHLLSNENLLKAMSQKAIERVNSNFTWEHVAIQMTGLYEKLMLSKRQTVIVNSKETRKIMVA